MKLRRFFQTKNKLFFPIRCFSSTQQVKLPKLEIEPYFALSDSIPGIKAKYQAVDLFKDASVRTGGRIVGRRKASKDLMFLDLQSDGHLIQVMLDHLQMRDVAFADVLEACQRGAIVGVEGFPCRTAAGEFTIAARKLSLLAQCRFNLPMMNWNHKHMLKDAEVRFQKRYLDLIVNNDLRRFFVTRARIIKFLRRYLDDLGFLEVETPVLNS